MEYTAKTLFWVDYSVRLTLPLAGYCEAGINEIMGLEYPAEPLAKDILRFITLATLQATKIQSHLSSRVSASRV